MIASLGIYVCIMEGEIFNTYPYMDIYIYNLFNVFTVRDFRDNIVVRFGPSLEHGRIPFLVLEKEKEAGVLVIVEGQLDRRVRDIVPSRSVPREAPELA